MKYWALQSAIFSRLTTFPAVMALVSTRVYDAVPQDVVFPHIQFGGDSALPFDTDTSVGGEHLITLHVWSRYRGQMEVKQVQAAIYEALHRHDLPVTGAHTVSVEYDASTSELDPDGLTRHGTISFRVTLDE